MEQDDTHDGKIFLLTLLLSNTLIFNSMGAIDENNISKLALVCRKAQMIDSSLMETTLYWVLRDFSLGMVNKEGLSLRSDDYLEECLKDGSQSHGRPEKELIKKFFQVRHCCPLVRPVIDEEKLRALYSLKREDFRS